MSEALQIRFLTVEEAAKELGKSDRWVSKLCKDGRLGQRFGGKVWMITEPELQEFLKIPRPRGRPKGKKYPRRKAAPLGESWSTIGECIKQQRDAQELTQKELAKHIGAYQPDIANYESGKHIPDTTMCQKLALVFRMDVAAVVTLAALTKLARESSVAQAS